MALYFKEGVKLKGLQPQMLLALDVIREVFDKLQCDTVVTSANDSNHMKVSKHYHGAAFDFRTKHTGRAEAVALEVKRLLCPLGFDVVLEDLGKPNEHLHVEYDPKEV